MVTGKLRHVFFVLNMWCLVIECPCLVFLNLGIIETYYDFNSFFIIIIIEASYIHLFTVSFVCSDLPDGWLSLSHPSAQS